MISTCMISGFLQDFTLVGVFRGSRSRGKVRVREPGWSRGSTSTVEQV